MQKFKNNEIELEREIQEQLLEWKEIRHQTVLQVEGPRQVGKTHEIKKFAYSHYEQVIYVNLVSDDYGFEDLMLAENFLEIYCQNAKLGHYVDDDSTILIIDEIQESTAVYNHIREFREWFACDIIVSGSYLARTVKSKDFFLPAGIAYLRLYPLSFREFCRALGLEDILMQASLTGESPEAEYEQLESAYQVYRHIGGYPEVVTTYIRTKDETKCLQTLENLINTFTSESGRFFSNSTALTIFKESYKAVLVQICEEKKGSGKNFLEFVTNFVKDSVKEAVSRNEIRAAATWLYYSGVLDYCDLYNNGDVTDVISNRRAYIADCGLAYYIADQVTIPRNVIEGMLTETFAYTELNRLYKKTIDKKTVRGDKPCFSICGDHELDFVVVDKQDKRFGIEIKTGNNQARSLAFFREKGMIDTAVKAGLVRGGITEAIQTIPVYMVGCRFPYDV